MTIYGEFELTEQINNGPQADLFTGFPLKLSTNGVLWMFINEVSTGKTYRLQLDSTALKTYYSGTLAPGNYNIIPYTAFINNTL